MIKLFKPLLVLLIFLTSLIVLSSTVLAENTSDTATSNANANSGKKQNTPLGLVRKLSSSNTGATAASKAGSRKPLLKIRLDQAKLRVCQVKEKVITNRSNNMV